MSSPTVTIFDPQGVARDIPYDMMKQAIASGGKPAVRMQAPDGTIRAIPADKMQEASQAGGKVLPLEQQEVQHPGFWASLGTDLKGMLSPSGVSPYPGMDVEAKQALLEQGQQADQSRKAAGYSAPYRALAPVAQGVGVNVPGMEQSAAEGDPAGVMGHAAAPVAAVGAAELVSRAGNLPKAIGDKAQGAAREMYQSALKPSTRLSPAKVESAITTGLNEEIPISKAGLDKLNDRLHELHQAVSDQIGNGQGKTIDPNAVAARVDQVRGKFTNQVNPGADLNAVDASKQEFLDNNQGPISADKAQAMKVGTYQQLGSRSYGELKTASIEAQKSLARGIKEELEVQFPELKNLNAREGQLYGLEGVLTKAVQRIGNHQLLGIGTPAAGMAAEMVTGSRTVGGIAGALKAVVDNPAVKSRLAIALNRAGRGRLSVAAANARVSAYAAALAQASSGANSEPGDDQTNQQ